MPIFDFPLSELQRYEGRNPRPDDFDAYWERGLAEVRAVDPQVSLIHHQDGGQGYPFAEFFDLYFTGVRGARVHAKYLRPLGVDGPHPAVLMFHGYSGHSGEWTDKLG